jgi:hypothetical protein
VAVATFNVLATELVTGVDTFVSGLLYLTALQEAATASDSFNARSLWEPINDSQTANWSNIDTSENANWAEIDNSSPTVWDIIQTNA